MIQEPGCMPVLMWKQTCRWQTPSEPLRSPSAYASGHKDRGQTCRPKWWELSRKCTFAHQVSTCNKQSRVLRLRARLIKIFVSCQRKTCQYHGGLFSCGIVLFQICFFVLQKKSSHFFGVNTQNSTTCRSHQSFTSSPSTFPHNLLEREMSNCDLLGKPPVCSLFYCPHWQGISNVVVYLCVAALKKKKKETDLTSHT